MPAAARREIVQDFLQCDDRVYEFVIVKQSDTAAAKLSKTIIIEFDEHNQIICPFARLRESPGNDF
jgi:hypothetical protein